MSPGEHQLKGSLRPVNVKELHKELRHALHHGASASSLFSEGNALIDLLAPAQEGDGDTYDLRAVKAEMAIRTGITRVGDVSAEALCIILGLKSDDLPPLAVRRSQAAKLFGVQPGTFRQGYEKGLLLDLAFEIYKSILNEGNGQAPCCDPCC